MEKIKLRIDCQHSGNHHSVVASRSRKFRKRRDFVFARKKQKSNVHVSQQQKHSMQFLIRRRKKKRFHSRKTKTLFWQRFDKLHQRIEAHVVAQLLSSLLCKT